LSTEGLGCLSKWAGAKRSSTITAIGDKAENSANVNDKLTQALQARITSVLNNPKLTNGMTDAEIQGMKDVQRGSPTVRGAEAVRKFTGSQASDFITIVFSKPPGARDN